MKVLPHFDEIFSMILPTMQKNGVRALVWLLFLLSPSLMSSQTLTPARFRSQEPEAQHERFNGWAAAPLQTH